ncbi:hypothetical protein ACFQ1I_03220 [Kitasatospora arboriphila]
MMHGDGGGWAWMMFLPLLWIGLAGLIGWAAVHLAHRLGRKAGRERPARPRAGARDAARGSRPAVRLG